MFAGSTRGVPKGYKGPVSTLSNWLVAYGFSRLSLGYGCLRHSGVKFLETVQDKKAVRREPCSDVVLAVSVYSCNDTNGRQPTALKLQWFPKPLPEAPAVPLIIVVPLDFGRGV